MPRFPGLDHDLLAESLNAEVQRPLLCTVTFDPRDVLPGFPLGSSDPVLKFLLRWILDQAEHGARERPVTLPRNERDVRIPSFVLLREELGAHVAASCTMTVVR